MVVGKNEVFQDFTTNCISFVFIIYKVSLVIRLLKKKKKQRN